MKKECNKSKVNKVCIDEIMIEKVHAEKQRTRNDFTAVDIVYVDKLDFIINVLVKLRVELKVHDSLSEKRMAEIKMMKILADQLNDF